MKKSPWFIFWVGTWFITAVFLSVIAERIFQDPKTTPTEEPAKVSMTDVEKYCNYELIFDGRRYVGEEKRIAVLGGVVTVRYGKDGQWHEVKK